MSLHTDWTDAKKDSKAKYKEAVKAKKAALEKDIKAGDPKARAKMLDKNLAELGIDGGSDDVDAFFRFKDGFGTALDKYEKAKAANAAIDGALAKVVTIEQILGNGKLLKAFIPFAKRTAIDDFLIFITTGYKMDPAQAVPLFIKAGAPKEINVDHGFLRELRAMANDPARLKVEGPAELKKVRDEAIRTLGPDSVVKFRNSREAAAALGDRVDLAPLKKTVEDIIDSYTSLIKAKESNWKNVKPDFRKPLLDALAAIKAAL